MINRISTKSVSQTLKFNSKHMACRHLHTLTPVSSPGNRIQNVSVTIGFKTGKLDSLCRLHLKGRV